MKENIIKMPKPLGRVGMYTLKNGKVNKIHEPNKNMVLDNFFESFFSGNTQNSLFNSGIFSECRVGTGSSEILPSTTALGNIHPARQQSHNNSILDAVEIDGIRYRPFIITYTFPHGSINAALTELALYANTNLSTIRFATLIKDADGVPVAFPVSDDEQLIVPYTVYWPCTVEEPDVLPTLGGPYLDLPYPVTVTINGQSKNASIYFRYSGTSGSGSSKYYYINSLAYSSNSRNIHYMNNSNNWNNLSSSQTEGSVFNRDITGRLLTINNKIIINGHVGTIDIKRLIIGPSATSISTTALRESSGNAILEFDEPYTKLAGSALEIVLNFTLDWS